MVTYSPMFETVSTRYSQACALAERDRCGSVPLGLPSDGFPRPEAFSQLVHIKGVRIQRDLHPRIKFNTALEAAAVNGLECYRFLRRSFIGMDHVPIALVPRGSNIVVAHIPAVLSQAADAVLALGHRLYFEVEGALRGIGGGDASDDDGEPDFSHPLRGGSSVGGGSLCGGSGSSSGSTSQRSLTQSGGLLRTRSGSIGGGKLTAWGPSSTNGRTSGAATASGCTGSGGGGGGGTDSSLPNRRGSVGTLPAAAISQPSFCHQSSSSLRSGSGLPSLPSFRSLAAALTRNNSNHALRYSDPELELTDPRVSDGDEDHITLSNGGRYSLDKLAVSISVFSDGEEGAQAFRQELAQRGVQAVCGEPSFGRPCSRAGR